MFWDISCRCICHCVEIFSFWLNSSDTTRRTFHYLIIVTIVKCFIFTSSLFCWWCICFIQFVVESRWKIATRQDNHAMPFQQPARRIHTFPSCYVERISVAFSMPCLVVFLSRDFVFSFALILFEILCLFDALRRLSFVTMVNSSKLQMKLCKVEMKALCKYNGHVTRAEMKEDRKRWRRVSSNSNSTQWNCVQADVLCII